MAAILQKLLEGEITTDELILWLKSPPNKDGSETLYDLTYLKTEFVPFFLNYLRDQTSHLLQGNRSAGNTPAKTPTTAKLKKLTTHPNDTHWPLPDESKKPHGSIASTPFDTRQTQGTSGNRSGHLDRSSFSDASLSKSGSASRKHGANRGRGGKSQRSIQFSTPDVHKTKNKAHSLADFIKSPSNDGRPQKSLNHWRDEASPSPGFGKRQGNKNKGSQNPDRKHRRNSQSNDDTTAPDFKLNNSDADFPPMGAVDDRLSSLPDGVKIITPSRRITPTLLSSGAPSEDNSLFKNAPIQQEACKAPASRGVWGQVANRDFSKHVTTAARSQSPSQNPPCSKPKRRIAPTLLSTVTESSSRDASPNVFNMSPIVSIPIDSDDPSTSKTTEKKVVVEPVSSPTKTPVKSKEATLSTVTPTKLALERMLSLEVAAADTSLVTDQNMLDILIAVYSACLNCFMVPNITVELYFIIQTLTARGGDLEITLDISRDVEEIQYLSTIHNAVYFAVMVLAKLTRLLSHLDRGTLRMLIDNQRVADFLPELKDVMCSLYELAPSKGLPKSLPSPIGGVSFQADTDNRKNFPSERAFNMFKKQRDSFYELLREWEENHLTPGWSMSHAQGDRIQQLVGYRVELANHIHFVRLFHSQLVQMCKGDSSWKKDEEDENITLLSELKQTNPKKLKRLRERLVTPASHGGPCPSPSFPGCQEFFRDFITAASNPFFNQHLCDVLVVKITEMNEIQLISVEVTYEEDEEIMIDVEDKETLLNCLLTSKLLAKFLGYVNFLPYHSPEVLPESMQTDYIEFRNKASPPFAILKYIEDSRAQRRTVITIPWVIEYLSMLDNFASQLDYYQHVFIALLRIYRESSEIFTLNRSPSNLLVLAVLGWLFELPSFPQGLLFKELVTTACDSGSRFALDNLGVVDQQILYSCCPYLGEMRSLLVDFAVGLSGRSSSVRKITPMSADIVEMSPATVSDKQLQHQLEDNFFHNHPASLKKTVEFVADRVSSNHIKVYRARDLPKILGEVTSHVKDLALEIVQGLMETPTLKQSQLLRSVDGSAASLSHKAKAMCSESAPGYCSERSQAILRLILPEETPAQVWGVAAQIAYRHTLDKVNNWLAMHITAHMFRKELTAELEKQVKALKKQLETKDNGTPSSARNTQQAGADTSIGTPTVLNTSGPEKTPSNVPLPAQHKSFLFESPVRALQDLSLKPLVTSEESPMRFVLNSALMRPPGSPSAKNCMNLSFDTGDRTLGSRALSSKLSKLSQEVQLASPQKSKDSSMLSITDTNICVQDTNNVKCGTFSEAKEPSMTYDTLGSHTVHLDESIAYSRQQELNFKDEKTNSVPSPRKGGRSPSKKLNVSFHEGDLDLEEFVELANPVLSVNSAKMPKPCIVNHIPIALAENQGHQRIPEGFCSPTDPLVALKECVRAVTMGSDLVSSASVCETLADVQHVVQNGSKDVVVLIIKMIAKLSVDLAFITALRHPELMTPAMQQGLLDLWTLEGLKAVADFSPALCPRHMKQLIVGGFQTTEGYRAFTNLTSLMLERELLTTSKLLKCASSNLTNPYLQPNILAVTSQILCDVLPKLKGESLQESNAKDLETVLQTLHEMDSDISRKQTLGDLLTRTACCSETSKRNLASVVSPSDVFNRKVLCSTENVRASEVKCAPASGLSCLGDIPGRRVDVFPSGAVLGNTLSCTTDSSADQL